MPEVKRRKHSKFLICIGFPTATQDRSGREQWRHRLFPGKSDMSQHRISGRLAAFCAGLILAASVGAQSVHGETVATGLEHPWALAFLPEGRYLVTERPGRMRVVEADGRLGPPLTGVPEVVSRGQGGL